MRMQMWLDRVLAFLDPHAGIRRARARAALEGASAPPRESPQQQRHERSFDRWWLDRMAARGWDRW
jgi:hypothetical protein